MTEKPDIFTELQRPFTVAAIRFKPLTKPFDGKCAAAFYIDARLVAARLNHVVGYADWSDTYRLVADGAQTPALYYPVECSLTVCDVTKTDIGQGPNTVLDEKAWKTAYSDALKRAGVKFGIGAYLYAIGQHWASVTIDSNGKAKGFSDEGKKYLRDLYTRWLASPLNTFGDPLDHGDVDDEKELEDRGPTAASAGAAPAQPAPAPSSDPADEKEAELFALVDQLGALNGSSELGTNTRKQCEANRTAWADDRSHYLDWLDKQIVTVTESLEKKKPEGASQFAELAERAQAGKAT